MGTKKWRFEEYPNDKYERKAPEAAEYKCLPNELGTNRWMKLTGIVTTKQRRNLKTGTETPIAAAMDSISKGMVISALECFALDRLGRVDTAGWLVYA